MTNETITKIANLAKTGKSRFGFDFEAITKATFTKAEVEAITGDRDANIEKVSKVTNGFLGRNYEKCVEAHSNMGAGGAGFKSSSLKGMHWVPDFTDILLESDKTPGKLYLRVAFDNMTKTETSYLVDGRPATPVELDTIKMIKAAKAKAIPATQLAVGVDKEVVVRNYSVGNISKAKAWGVNA